MSAVADLPVAIDWPAIAESYMQACRHMESELSKSRVALACAIRELQAVQFPDPDYRKIVLTIDQHKVLRVALLDVIAQTRCAIQSEKVPDEPDSPEDAFVQWIREYGMLFNALFPRPRRRRRV